MNNDAEPVFFGNNVANVAKFGTYFIRDGKVTSTSFFPLPIRMGEMLGMHAFCVLRA